MTSDANAGEGAASTSTSSEKSGSWMKVRAISVQKATFPEQHDGAFEDWLGLRRWLVAEGEEGRRIKKNTRRHSEGEKMSGCWRWEMGW